MEIYGLQIVKIINVKENVVKSLRVVGLTTKPALKENPIVKVKNVKMSMVIRPARKDFRVVFSAEVINENETKDRKDEDHAKVKQEVSIEPVKTENIK